MMERTAKCLCGQFSVIVTSEPVTVNVCHCQDCQRRSGVPWTSNAYFPKEHVRLDGPNKIYTRTSNAGTRINHHFCPNCGVTVCWARESGSTRVGIPGAVRVILGGEALRIVASNQRCQALGHPAAATLIHRHRELMASVCPQLMNI